MESVRPWWLCIYHNNQIKLNINLVHVPIKYLEYVIAHEVTHFKEKNHKKAFRNLLKILYTWCKKTNSELSLYHKICNDNKQLFIKKIG